MLEHSYSKWLEKEVLAIKYALLCILEKRDQLLYIEMPALRQLYMEKIGFYEEQVLKAELELSLLEEKKQLIQTAINRREPVDLEKMEKQLEEEKNQQLEQLNENYKNDFIESYLSQEEMDELQKLYKQIVQDFHPEVHKELSNFQKNLYKRAMTAYQKQQLEELRLVYEMLYAKDKDGTSIQLNMKISLGDGGIEDLEKQMMEDYSLAAELYECFEALEDDGILLSIKQQYEVREQEAWNEIEQIQMRFPFIAKETLESEELTKEYLKSLELRMNICREQMAELNQQIAKMLEG